MFFSVVVPLYNNEKYIVECLDSIINQTEKSFEVVVVNDGSTDDSQTVVEKYVSQFENIQLINQENKGLLHSRAVGIDYARGEFVIFVDSDDKIKPDTLSILKNQIEQDNLDIVIYNLSRFNDNEDIMESWNNTLSTDVIFEEEKKIDLYKTFLSTNRLNSMAIKAVKRTCFTTAEIYTYPDVRNGEDILHTLPVITNGKKIKYINDVLYMYRVNNESMTRKFNIGNYKGSKVIYQAFLNYFKKWKIEDEQLIKMLNKRFLIEVAKLVVYEKSNLEKEKKEYLILLDNIRKDDFYKEIYKEASSRLPSIYKVPNQLIFKGQYKILYWFKNLVYRIRR